MRTKTLLLSAAALAAGVIASQAQSNVYSANVVGYATVVYPGSGQFTLLANPFDDGNGDISTNIMDSANSLPAKSELLTWNVGTQTFTIVSKSASGWASSPALIPGNGFFVRNGNTGTTVSPITNTFVGSVIVQNGQSVTNPIPIGFSLNGTPIPYAGNLAIVGLNGGDTNMDFGSEVTAKSEILTWNTATQTYNIVSKSATGWGATVTINPTDGFFVFNKAGPASNVVETLNLQ